MTFPELKRKADLIWEECLRLHAREPGVRIASVLSCVELLTVLYYGNFLHYDAQNPLSPARDRVIASKGHGALALYPILADLGFFPQSELEKMGEGESLLGMIPDPGIPGIETVNGSLGHGVGVGLGMALSLKQTHDPAKVIVLHGDGELGEGAVWEAVSLAGTLQMENLFMILDVNGKSMLGPCRHTAQQWEKIFDAWSWRTGRCDGHDIESVYNGLQTLFAPGKKGPCVLIAETVKGHGVPELERADLAHIMNLKAERIRELIAERRAC